MNPIVLFSLIILCISVQLWLVLVAVSAAIPQANVLSTVVWPEWQYMVVPERDALLFHCFVGLALSGQAVGIWLVRRKLNEPSFIKAIKPFLVTELVWTALMLNATFKVIVYPDRSALAHDAFIFLSACALLSKIFWTELKGLVPRVYQKMLSWPLDIRADVLVCLGLIALLYVPDAKVVLARMFFGDHFRHFDTFMAPAWAYSKGAVLNVDVITEYGIGIPAAMSWFAKLAGGFNYIHMLWFFMDGTILYFILCFVFLRRWFGSFTLALITVLLAVKFQVFHYTNAPFVFTFPSHTVMRYFWDIVFFLLVLGHLRTLHKWYLLAAAVCCGVEVFWMTTSGYCLTIAYLAYLTAFMVVEDLRKLVCKEISDCIWLSSFIAVVPLTALFLFGAVQGSHLWTHDFWNNMQEFNNYFLSGLGLMPIYENFQHKEVLLGAMSFFIPLAYMWTLLLVAGLLYWGKAHRDDLIAVVVSLYGLAMYHYFMGRSGVDDYYSVSVPYAFILGFWAKRGLMSLQAAKRRPVLLSLLAVSVYALISNHMYLSYPNILNISRNPVVDPRLVQPLADGHSYFNASINTVTEGEKLPVNSLGEKDEGIKHENDFKNDDELKSYYDQESDFSKDAALIASLTKPADAVALLSGFEIKILMQADRRPFFYYSSPIIVTRPMRMRTFPTSNMFSWGHAQKTLLQLQTAKPPYVFMEKIFLQAPGTNNFKDAALATVLNYVFINYTPYVQGQYLVAFKRKGI